MSETEQNTEVEDSTEAGLMAGAGDVGKESFEIFNGIPGGTVFHWLTGEKE